MSLQGTLETFALPDVLVLLSSTKKDGELRVVGGRIDGKVWLEKGEIVHSNIGGTDAKPVDAIFELLRLEVGTFNFDNESQSPKKHEAIAIDGVLADAQIRLGEWNEIARVVPHLDAIVDMADDAPSDEVIITRDQWSMLRRVAGGRSVHDLMVALGQSEFDTCKAIKELVESRLASIDVDAAPKAAAPAPKATETPRSKSEDIVEEAVAKAAQAAQDKADRVQESAVAAAKVDADAAAEESASKNGIAPAKVAEPAEPSKISATTTTRKTDEADGERVAKQDELDALAELASRPRKVRATTSTEAEAGATGPRPTATKTPGEKPVEEARALVAQLAALSGDDEAEVAAKVTEHLASGGELPEVPDGDEPINRGLLLKFLSSVRN